MSHRKPEPVSAINVHDLDDLAHKVYWALDQLTSPAKDRFTASEIAEYLVEEAHFETSRQAVEYAIGKASGRAVGGCNKNRNGYKLMQAGRDELLKFAHRDKVIFIDANKPFKAKNFTFKEIVGDSYSEVSICDTYVDLNTLDVIYKNFIPNVPIRLLTANVIDKPPGTFKRHLTDLASEKFSVEVRIYNSSTLHDRYIIDDRRFWLSGNSLNHLGSKESFFVELGADIRQSMLATFNSRWKVARPF